MHAVMASPPFLAEFLYRAEFLSTFLDLPNFSRFSQALGSFHPINQCRNRL
jgi:hypothetical protein